MNWGEVRAQFPALSRWIGRVAERSRRALDGHFDGRNDRDERAGVKFKDAESIGIPFRITVWKMVAQGLVEFVERRGKACI